MNKYSPIAWLNQMDITTWLYDYDVVGRMMRRDYDQYDNACTK